MTQEPYKITPRCCPNCHKKVNATTTVMGESCAPRPGDFDICFYCAHITEVNGEGKYISVTEERLKEIQTKEPDFYRILQKAQQRIQR